jgi:hypothetical protein
MECLHHTLRIVLRDDWLAEAGMIGFVPSSVAYAADRIAFPGERICQVRIQDIGPVMRAAGVGVFNRDRETGSTARARTVSILRAFQSGSALPPVKLVRGPDSYGYPYKLTDGCHRLYCSLAVGFTHIPAVKGFDMKMLYEPDDRDLC